MPYKDKALNDLAKRNYKKNNPEKVREQGQVYFQSNKENISTLENSINYLRVYKNA